MKKIISLLTSAVMTISLFMSASFHVIASIYEKDYNDTLFNYIIKLPGEPLAKYPEAQSLGVDKFIFTDEGQLRKNMNLLKNISQDFWEKTRLRQNMNTQRHITAFPLYFPIVNTRS